jgi:hypothetical protein
VRQGCFDPTPGGLLFDDAVHFFEASAARRRDWLTRFDWPSAIPKVASRVPASPRLRLDTVAPRWSERFGRWWRPAIVAPAPIEAHRFDHDLLPRLGHRRIAALGVLIAGRRSSYRGPTVSSYCVGH